MFVPLLNDYRSEKGLFNVYKLYEIGVFSPVKHEVLEFMGPMGFFFFFKPLYFPLTSMP